MAPLVLPSLLILASASWNECVGRVCREIVILDQAALRRQCADAHEGQPLFLTRRLYATNRNVLHLLYSNPPSPVESLPLSVRQLHLQELEKTPIAGEIREVFYYAGRRATRIIRGWRDASEEGMSGLSELLLGRKGVRLLDVQPFSGRAGSRRDNGSCYFFLVPEGLLSASQQKGTTERLVRVLGLRDVHVQVDFGTPDAHGEYPGFAWELPLFRLFLLAKQWQAGVRSRRDEFLAGIRWDRWVNSKDIARFAAEPCAQLLVGILTERRH